MSSIETIGKTQIIDSDSAERPQISKAEELNKMIQTIAVQRLQIAKLRKECSFVKDLLFCFLFPTSFTNQSASERLIKKYEISLTADQRSVDEWTRLVKDLDEANLMYILIQKLNKICVQTLDSDFMDKQKQEITKTGDLIKYSENLLDQQAGILNSIWTAEEWKFIQETFEKESLAFSQNFIDRCQRVAQKVIAA